MIYHADYRDILGQLADNSVQLILTDPPYGVNYKSTHGVKVANDREAFSYKPLAVLAHQKLKPGGVIIAFTGWSVLPGHFQEFAASGLLTHPWFTFQRRNAGAGTINHLADNCERALFASKGPYTLQETRLVKNKKAGTFGGKAGDRILVREWKTRLPFNWFGDEYPFATAPSGSIQTADKHPTGKNPELGRWLILALTKPGDVVCDPFCGSGAFMQAAKDAGRAFIGCDIDKEWADYSYRRVMV